MRNLLLLLMILLYSAGHAQVFYADPLAHTFSIVARDPQTGEMGVAVQSHWFSVGSVVSWAEAGVGAIATQSFVNPALGQKGLKLLREGFTAQKVLDSLIGLDEGRDVRQFAVLDAKGNTAVWTGSKCIPDAGDYHEANFSVQANLMLNKEVWPAMAKAFRETNGQLAERMIAALEAGQARRRGHSRKTKRRHSDCEGNCNRQFVGRPRNGLARGRQSRSDQRTETAGAASPSL